MPLILISLMEEYSENPLECNIKNSLMVLAGTFILLKVANQPSLNS